MGAYDLIARRYHLAVEDDADAPAAVAEPFKLLIDDEARRAVLERAIAIQPTRGHRNPIKAAPLDNEDA